MDTVACYVNEYGASLSFSDGHHEKVQTQTLHQSALLQRLLSDTDSQPHTTLAAPYGVIRRWLRLKSILADVDCLQNISCHELVEYLQAADFMDDATAIGNVHDILGARLFKPKKEAPSARTQVTNPDEARQSILQAMGSLDEALATEVLRTAMVNATATMDDLSALVPGPLDAAVCRVALPWAFHSRNLEIDCFKYTTATSSACLANLSTFPIPQHITIKLAAHSYFVQDVGIRHWRHLHSALDHATRNNVPVDLHIQVSCEASLKQLLRCTFPSSNTIHSLTLCDTHAAASSVRSPSRLFWHYALPGHYPGLQSLSILHSPSLEDRSRVMWDTSHQQRMTATLASFTGLTKLYIHESIPATQPAVFLRALSQLRDLDACFTVCSEQELYFLESALSALTQLTKLALGDTRSCTVRRLAYCHQMIRQGIPVPEFYASIAATALGVVEEDEEEAMRLKCFGPVSLMWLQLPSSAPLQHLDLSHCIIYDDMLVALTAQLQAMAASRGPTLQHLELSVLQPGAATLALLRALQIFPDLKFLSIQSEVPYKGAEELEGLVCSLKSLQHLGLCDLCTRGAVHDRRPLLTALTRLSSLVLGSSTLYGELSMPIPAAISDSRFFEGLQYLTQLHTLTLSSVRLATVSDVSAIAYFSSCLQTLHSLRSLCVSFAPPVHPEAAQLLSTGIAALQQLTELQLCQTGGHDPEAAAHALGDLCASLHHLSCLAHLHVEGAQLSPECCTSFGQALVCPALSGLQQLTVKSCLLEDGAYQSLAHELQAHVSAVPTSKSEDPKSLGHLGLIQLTWSSIGLKDADCMHLARIISLFPNLDSCSLQGLGLSRMCTHGAIRSALMHLKKLQHVDLRDNGQWSAAQLGLLCCLPRGNPQLREVDIGKVSDRQIQREGRKGWDLMSEAEKVLKPWKDPMRCLNLQGVTTAYSDYWWAVAIQWSLTGVGLLIFGGCVRSQMKKCAA